MWWEEGQSGGWGPPPGLQPGSRTSANQQNLLRTNASAAVVTPVRIYSTPRSPGSRPSPTRAGHPSAGSTGHPGCV